jgi:tetratricopeptide (TPR) repeat protein
MKKIGVLVFIVSRLLAQNPDLGRIDFPTSGPPEAQKRFLRGVLLLHSFEYDDAREEFRRAQEIAPNFAMAYWGEAMTYNEPLWFAQDRDAARSALKRFASTPATAREKEYLQAVHVLYGDGEKESRDFAYAEAMKRLSEKYPGDAEAGAFYALALLGTSHQGRDFRIYMRAGARLEELFRRNPEHPGVLHYLLHAYDDPIHAPLGLRAARTYAKVAPAAAHALHMPSHIFLALGMWDEVVQSNEAAWAASQARAEHRDYHSLWWLAYGHLQQGRFEDARRALQIVGQDARQNSSRLIRFHLVQMRSAYQIETGQPYPIRGGVDTSNLDLPAVAGDLLATGFLAINRGDRAEAERSLAAIRKLSPASGPPSPQQHAHLYPADVQAVEIAEKELAALLLQSDGRSKEALQLIAEAAAVEDRMSFEFGPPAPPKPARELFGEILLQLARPQEARRQFELSLLRTPRRALSLLGRARALAQSGDLAGAREAYTELRRIWHRADADVQKALADTGP